MRPALTPPPGLPLLALAGGNPRKSTQDPEPHCQPLAPRTPALPPAAGRVLGRHRSVQMGPPEAALLPRALPAPSSVLPDGRAACGVCLLCKPRPLSGCWCPARARRYRTESARGAGRGGAQASRHLGRPREPGLVGRPGAREGAALRAGRGPRAAPAAAAEERGEERGGGARGGGGQGEGGGARRAPCKAALFIWAQPQPPRWEAQGGKSSPTGELRSGPCQEGPGAGRRARGAAGPC